MSQSVCDSRTHHLDAVAVPVARGRRARRVRVSEHERRATCQSHTRHVGHARRVARHAVGAVLGHARRAEGQLGGAAPRPCNTPTPRCRHMQLRIAPPRTLFWTLSITFLFITLLYRILNTKHKRINRLVSKHTFIINNCLSNLQKSVIRGLLTR